MDDIEVEIAEIHEQIPVNNDQNDSEESETESEMTFGHWPDPGPHIITGPYDEIPILGASIGTANGETSGTFGAYITAKNKDGEEDLLALTSKHVAITKTGVRKGKLTYS